MKRNLFIAALGLLAAAGIWLIAGDIDDTTSTDATVTTVTKVSSITFTYADTGDIATVTATVTRTKDDGSGAVVTKSGSRTFTRDEVLASGLAKATNVIDNLEKKGANSLRTWLFTETNIGS